MKTKTLLIVEDSEDDLFFLRKALARMDILHSFSVVNDGLAAVAYLCGEGIYADRTFRGNLSQTNQTFQHSCFQDRLSRSR